MWRHRHEPPRESKISFPALSKRLLRRVESNRAGRRFTVGSHDLIIPGNNFFAVLPSPGVISSGPTGDGVKVGVKLGRRFETPAATKQHTGIFILPSVSAADERNLRIS